MPPDPGSPADWLRHARSDLALAKVTATEHVLRETLCFHAQQAAEKSLKAVLILRGIPFPKTHNLAVLLDVLPDTLQGRDDIAESLSLTQYAVDTRYPGTEEPIGDAEYAEAIRLAEAVWQWAEVLVADAGPH